MAYALVKLGTVATNTLNSVSPTFGQATTAGNLLVAWLGCNDGGSTAPWTTTASGWTTVNFGGAFEWIGIAYKPNCGASETAPVFTNNSATQDYGLLGEFSGGATSTPADKQGDGGAAGGATQTATASAGDSVAKDLIISCTYWNGNSNTSTITTTITDSNGSAVTANVTNNSGATSGTFYNFAWGVAGAVTGGSGDKCVASISNFSNGGCGIMSFKPAAAGPTYTDIPYVTQYSGWF